MLNYHSDKKLFYLESDDANLLKVAYAKHVLTKNNTYIWTFPGTFPDGLVSLKDLHAIMPKLEISKDAHERLQYLQSIPDKITNLEVTSNITDIHLPIEPFAHQWKAIEATLHYPKLAIVYQQGLGKTFVAIASLLYKQRIYGMSFGKTLIIMPKILLNNWAAEIDKYGLDNLRYRILTATTKNKFKKNLDNIIYEFANNNLDILITNFETFVARNNNEQAINNINAIKNINFNRIIIDEASRLAAANSKRAENIMSIAEKANEVYLLSGTISVGSPLDVYTPYTIMHNGIFGTNYYKFRNKHCIFSSYNKHAVVGYKNVADIKKKISNYTILETRDNCLSLPDRLILEKHYPLTDEQLKWYNAVVSMDEIPLDHINKDLIPLNVKQPVVKIIKLRQILSGFINLATSGDVEPIIYKFENGKLELLRNILQSTDERAIIWYSLKQELIDIENLLKELNITYVLASEKESYLKYEQTPDIRIFLGQISQGIGITLNSAKVMYYYSNSLKLEDREQSMDRNYRIGQSNKVVVYDFVHKDSIDSSILTLIKKKVDVKNFIQDAASCLLCDKLQYCTERAIKIYSSRCKYDSRVKSVERVQRITFKQLKD